jgi:hypothetical protein
MDWMLDSFISKRNLFLKKKQKYQEKEKSRRRLFTSNRKEKNQKEYLF